MIYSIPKFLERYSVCNAKPDLLQLQAVAAAFSHLPYENVTKILKHARSSNSGTQLRQAEEVLADHLRWNTGGTCFSLCNALSAVLSECGFAAFIAMGDMHYGSNIHCAIVATIAKSRYLLDPGYLLHDPIPLPEDNYEVVRKTQMNTIILRSEGSAAYSLYTVENSEEKWRYRLRAIPTSREEFTGYWMHSFSLNTMEQVMLSRLSESGRLYFRKDRLDLVSQQKRQKEKFPSVETLSSVFGVPKDLILLAQNAV